MSEIYDLAILGAGPGSAQLFMLQGLSLIPCGWKKSSLRAVRS